MYNYMYFLVWSLTATQYNFSVSHTATVTILVLSKLSAFSSCLMPCFYITWKYYYSHIIPSIAINLLYYFTS